MLSGVAQEGMGASPPRATLAGGNIPLDRQGFGQREGSAWGSRSMLGIPEQRTLPLLNWGSGHPCKPTCV